MGEEASLLALGSDMRFAWGIVALGRVAATQRTFFVLKPKETTMWILVSLFCFWLILFVLVCARYWAFAWGAAVKTVAFSKRELALTFSAVALLSFVAGFLGYYLGTGNPRPALLASAYVHVYELMGATPLSGDEWAIALRASNEDSVVLYASSPLPENLKGVRFFTVEGREGKRLRLRPMPPTTIAAR